MINVELVIEIGDFHVYVTCIVIGFSLLYRCPVVICVGDGGLFCGAYSLVLVGPCDPFMSRL